MSKNLHQRGAQGRHAAAKELQALVNENKVSQVYDCTRIKVFTHDHHIREGETILGSLTMTEEFENFEFHQRLEQRWTRNPIIWHGEYINVHRDKLGNYQACFRRMTIGKRFSPVRVANAISTELLTAKKMLGL